MMTNDRVIYQLEKAESALRLALSYGYKELGPYALTSISGAIKAIDNAKFSTKVVSKEQ